MCVLNKLHTALKNRREFFQFNLLCLWYKHNGVFSRVPYGPPRLFSPGFQHFIFRRIQGYKLFHFKLYIIYLYVPKISIFFYKYTLTFRYRNLNVLWIDKSVLAKGLWFLCGWFVNKIFIAKYLRSVEAIFVLSRIAHIKLYEFT